MATSKKPRKKYKPGRAMLEQARRSEGKQPITAYDSYMLELGLANHNAMDALVHGIATCEHMNALMAMSNATVALVHLGFGKEYDDVVTRGYEALSSVIERGKPTARFICKAPEIVALNELLEVHEAQVEVIRVTDLESAISIAKAKKIPRLFHKEIKLI